MLDEEGRGGESGGEEGDQAGLLRGEGECRGRAEEERPGARFPLFPRMEIAGAGPEHHEEETGEENLLDIVGREEGEEGRSAEQQGEHEAGHDALREAF